MEEHDGSLTFQQVATRFLAVQVFISTKVEEIIVNLECDTSQKSEFDKLRQFILKRSQRTCRNAANYSDTQRGNNRIPASLLIGHPDVVAIAKIKKTVRDPSQFDGLALG